MLLGTHDRGKVARPERLELPTLTDRSRSPTEMRMIGWS